MSAPAASTTEAVAAEAASRGEDAAAGSGAAQRRPAAGGRFDIGARLLQPGVRPYERRPGEPLYRRLRIYTVDPSLARLDGAVATLNVPYEPLAPGPVGATFAVVAGAAAGGPTRVADLDDPFVLMADGYDPSPNDPRFHQQMVYAVCCNVHASFRVALGRDPSWSFGGTAAGGRLLLRPHHAQEANAWYERTDQGGELRFGFFVAPRRPTDRTMSRGFVFTCLSHDVIVHECTHALLDGLRTHFLLPTSADVIGFHEAFADLVALLQRFSYKEVVLAALRRSRGALHESGLLAGLASQMGHATGHNGPMRTALDGGAGQPDHQPRPYAPGLEPHELGSVLVSAVFEAFATVFRRKTERLVRLASSGTGVLPAGELPHDLQVLLADKAAKLAGQFLALCIRAIDYCPPVGVTFGDYLRALVTADHDLVPDDAWDYRGALIDAFWRRNIYPRSAAHLSQDALLWKPPRIDLQAVPGLDFAALRFAGDPGRAAAPEALAEQAARLGAFVTEPKHLEEFGLLAADDPRLGGCRVGRPSVESIRCARRAGPQGQVAFDLVAEVTQALHVPASGRLPAFSYHGGCTVILSPLGEVRYAILKSALGAERLARRQAFFASELGQRFWELRDGELRPRKAFLARLHGQRHDTRARDDCSAS